MLDKTDEDLRKLILTQAGTSVAARGAALAFHPEFGTALKSSTRFLNPRAGVHDDDLADALRDAVQQSIKGK